MRTLSRLRRAERAARIAAGLRPVNVPDAINAAREAGAQRRANRTGRAVKIPLLKATSRKYSVAIVTPQTLARRMFGAPFMTIAAASMLAGRL